MTDLRQCSRQFLTEFITLYESLPCLWHIKSKDYSDRNKKGEAYEMLVDKFKEIQKTANRETVVKKINSIRTVYRKELRKVNKSIKSGAGEDEVYVPSLWYFDLLHFLRDQETPRPSKNTMYVKEEVGEIPEQMEEDGHESGTDGEHIEAPATPLSEASTPHANNTLPRNTSRSHSSTRKRKGVPNDDDTTEIIKLVGKKLESLQQEDAFQVFGKHVANKLRDVPSSQNAIAQKLISDILFEAEMCTLNRNFKLLILVDY